LLVNNAAVFEPDDIRALNEALWEQHFGVNLRAPVFLAGAFADQLPDHAEGGVVNVVDQRVFKQHSPKIEMAGASAVNEVPRQQPFAAR
jgi:NAD(P)-dependent dehydrogenase (short-subunit alcohol dehydrogenase family)